MSAEDINNLIKLLLEESFGKQIAAIADVIYKKGPYPLKDIIKETGLPYTEVRTGLIMLIKNNIVSFRNAITNTVPSSIGDKLMVDEKVNLVYKFEPQECLMRVRYPKFLKHIKKLFGPICGNLFLEVMEFGSLSASECIEQVFEKYLKDDKFFKGDLTSLRADFLAMVARNYLIRSSVDNTLAKGSGNDQRGKAKGTSYGKKKYENKKDSLEDKIKNKRAKKAEEKKINRNKKSQKKEGLDQDFLALIGGGEFANDSAKDTKKIAGDSKQISMIDKSFVKDDNSLLVDPTTKEDIYFRVNARQLIHEFRAETIVDMTVEKINLQASAIIHSILKKSKAIGRALDVQQTESFSVDRIFALLPEKPEITKNSLLKYLDLLHKDEAEFLNKTVSGVKDGNNEYSVNLEGLIKSIWQKCVEKVIEEKYGHYHARIFRILIKKGSLDEKKVSELCLMPQKETRSMLNELYQGSYVCLQELQPKTGGILYLYNVKMGALISTLIRQLYKTIFNLKMRLNAEEEKFMSIGIAVNSNIDAYEKLKASLEGAIMEIDECLMTLNDF